MNNKKFYSILDSVFDRDRCFERLCKIHSLEKWISYDKYKENAVYCEQQMIAAGLEQVEHKPLVADGVAVYNDWQVPSAWNARSATLKFPDGEVLADYETTPCSLCMYSNATPVGGIVAEVAVVDDAAAVPEDGSLKGKLLLVSKPSAGFVDLAVRAEAVGILTDFFPLFPGVRDSREDVRGIHRWDCLSQGKHSLFGFSLAPEQGDRLREMAKSGSVTLCAEVDAGPAEGSLYVISGAILGTDPSLPEVCAYAHLDEPGANDNASGASALLELGCCLTDAIKKGLLPRPKHTIRFILGPEYDGSIGYTYYYPDRKRLCLCVADMVGNETVDRTHMDVCLAPLANRSYMDAAMLTANERYDDYASTSHFVSTRPFWPGSDNVISDPILDTPSVSFGNYPALSYHSSMDTPDCIEPDILKRNGMIVGDVLYMLADTDMEICSILEKKLHEIFKNEKYDFEKRHALLKESLIRSLASLTRICETYIPESAVIEEKYDMPESVKANGGERIPVRIVKGPLNFATHPEIRKEAALRTDHYTPLFWADGKRNLWEISVRTALELHHEKDEELIDMFNKLEPLFDVLSKYGYTDWK